MERPVIGGPSAFSSTKCQWVCLLFITKTSRLCTSSLETLSLGSPPKQSSHLKSKTLSNLSSSKTNSKGQAPTPQMILKIILGLMMSIGKKLTKNSSLLPLYPTSMEIYGKKTLMNSSSTKVFIFIFIYQYILIYISIYI